MEVEAKEKFAKWKIMSEVSYKVICDSLFRVLFTGSEY